MTKSEFIRARAKPLVKMIEKFTHPEQKSTVASAIEVYLLRLIIDLEWCGDADEDKSLDYLDHESD